MNMCRLLYFSYSLIKPQKYLGPDEFCLLISGRTICPFYLFGGGGSQKYIFNDFFISLFSFQGKVNSANI